MKYSKTICVFIVFRGKMTFLDAGSYR